MMLPRLLRCAACAASAGPSARLDRAARLATSAPAPAAALSRYAGKVAMVTASTAGIGLAIARRLAQEGAAVVISSRREANVQGAVAALKEEGLNVTGMVCHVSKPADRQRLVAETLERHGRLDVLVSNAAANPCFGPTLDTTEEQWNKIFDVNVTSSFLLAKDTVPHLLQTKGTILFVSSIAGYTPFDNLGPYSVSKTALFGLTKVLANELGPKGVRINALAPGVIRTDFSKVLYQDDRVREKLLRHVPLKRLGEVEDMAGTAAFLCSSDAAYVTGEVVVAAGGMTARL